MRAIAVAGVALATMAGTAMGQVPDLPPGVSTSVKVREGIKNADVRQIDYPGDKDAVYFYAKKGANLGVWARGFCHALTVGLYDRNMKRLAEDAPASPDADAFAEHRAPYTGRYFMTVQDRPTPPGYQCPGGDEHPIYISAVINNCGHDRLVGCRVGLGTTGIRYIWGANDQAWARFEVTKPGVYTIIGADVGGIQSWRDGGAIMSLRKASTAVITATGRQDAYQCNDTPVGCLKAKLQAGTYFVTMRMRDIKIYEGYRITIKAG